MPIQIGGPPTADFNDPIGLMTACHRRIERFLAVLQHVAARLPAQLDAREGEALAGAVRYFREAAPHHTSDEEQSLAPRLFAVDAAELMPVRLRWKELEADHRRKEGMLPDLLDAAEVLLGGGAVDHAAFSGAVGGLAAIYVPHIAYEDGVLFPLARRLLSPSAVEAMGREMAERRGVGWGR